jgi:hypothetical protein
MEHPGQDHSAREELFIREEFFFFWGPEVTNQELPERRRAYLLVEMLLDLPMPFTSLSKSVPK